MEIGNLGNVLGAIVGFATVMLLLSILVTGASQSMARIFDLRWRVGRNLVRSSLAQELKLAPDVADWTANALYGLDAKTGASRLERVWAMLRWHESVELDWMKFEKAVRGLETLSDEIVPTALPDLEKVFMRMVARISDRYAYRMRQVTIAASFVVALALQVSATQLINDLSTSDVLRLRSLELSSQALQDGERIERIGEPFRKRAAEALEELEHSHPEVAVELEEMSAISDTADEVLEELRLVLKGRPDRDALLTAYRQILARQERGLRVDQAQLASFAQDGLGTLNLRVAEDLCFYTKIGTCRRPGESGWLRFGNLLGALATAIFLTFGAPFWYETLKKVNVFQNALRAAVRADDPLPSKPNADGAEGADGESGGSSK